MQSREERQAWIDAKVLERSRQKAKEAQIAADALEVTKDKLWSPFASACLLHNELNLSWKGEVDFFRWDRVFVFQDLVAVRITGYALTELPLELATSLPLLECLSLIANALESLPENIGLLVHLTDIDVTKNKLQHLPDSICDLDRLTSLNLSNNQLQELPANFGRLVRLQKVWAEKNQLTSTPATFGQLRSTVVNLSCNAFVHWDLALPEFSNLTTLSINFNHLKGLPATICGLPSLTSLSAANNAITSLPDAFGLLPKLRCLRLDWNHIRELPFSFRHLSSLQEIHMEHNPMVSPPLDVIYEGPAAVLAFVLKQYLAWLRMERRQIVEQLAAALSYVEGHMEQNQWTDFAAYVEPGVHRTLQGTKLEFFAVVVPALASDILPALRPIMEAQHHPEVPKAFFERSLDDIVDALTYYDDEYGTAGLFNEKARFRKCMCVDAATGVRTPCSLLSLGYACERDACLVRVKMVTTEEYKEMQGDTYLMSRRERLSNAMKRKCVNFINSEEGIAFFEKTAEAQGKLWMANLARAIADAKANAKAEKNRVQARKKTAAKLQTLSKKTQKHHATLRKSIAKWEADLATLADATKRTLKRDQLAKLKDRQKELEGRLEKARKELHQDDPMARKLQAKLRQLEDPSVSATSHIDEDDDEDAKDDSRGDDSDAASDDEDDEDDSEDDEDDIDDDEDDSDDDDATSGDDSPDQSDSESDNGETKSVFDALGEIPGLEPCVDWIQDATDKVNAIMAARPPKDKPYLEDVIALFHEELRHTYVREKTTRVRNKVTTEFFQMKYVLRRWMGHDHRVLFVAWRDYVRSVIVTRDKTSQKQAKDEALAVQNQLAQVALGRLEAAKWERKMNYYTDEYYYQHTVTGEQSALPPPYWDDVQQGTPRRSSSSFLPPLVASPSPS